MCYSTRWRSKRSVQIPEKGVATIRLTETTIRWKDPATWVMLLIAVIPLFPEYISFFLVIAAAIVGFFVRWQQPPVRPRHISRMLLLYISYIGLGLAYTIHKNSTLITFAMWGFFFGMFCLLRSLLTSRERFETLACFMTLTAGVVGLIACLQFYIGDFTKTNPIRFWECLDKRVYSWLPIRTSELSYTLRSCSTFNNPNVLSEYLTMTLPFGVFYATGQPEATASKHIANACLILMVAGVMFSFSRGGYIALMLLLAALAFFNLRKHFSSIVIYAFSGLLLIPGRVVERMLSILPGIKTGSDILDSFKAPAETVTSAAQEIINASGADVAINIRWQIWLESLRYFLKRPFFGYGAGVHTTWELLRQRNLPILHAHNLVLQLLMEGGLVALAIFLCLGFRTAGNGLMLMRKNWKPRSFWLGYALIGFGVAFCVQGVFDYPLMTPKLVCHFMLIMALAERSVYLFDVRPLSLRKYWQKRRQAHHAAPPESTNDG